MAKNIKSMKFRVVDSTTSARAAAPPAAPAASATRCLLLHRLRLCGQGLAVRHEGKAGRVDAVPLAGGAGPIGEDVAKVGAAASIHDLHPRLQQAAAEQGEGAS
jgi:hypothetical protein